jgi:CRP-like cAMP-binding protein
MAADEFHPIQHDEDGEHTSHHHVDDLKHFAKDAVVFSAGDPGNTMYVCVRGQIEIRIGDRVVDVIHPGGILGELGVIDPGPRAANAVATAPTDLLEIDEKEFLKLVQTTPFFALKLLRLLTARLKRSQTIKDLKV